MKRQNPVLVENNLGFVGRAFEQFFFPNLQIASPTADAKLNWVAQLVAPFSDRTVSLLVFNNAGFLYERNAKRTTKKMNVEVYPNGILIDISAYQLSDRISAYHDVMTRFKKGKPAISVIVPSRISKGRELLKNSEILKHYAGAQIRYNLDNKWRVVLLSKLALSTIEKNSDGDWKIDFKLDSEPRIVVGSAN